MMRQLVDAEQRSEHSLNRLGYRYLQHLCICLTLLSIVIGSIKRPEIHVLLDQSPRMLARTEKLLFCRVSSTECHSSLETVGALKMTDEPL